MANYDPQRTRPTPGVADGPAPVDGLLDSAGADPDVTATPIHTLGNEHEHVHGEDCDHGELSIARIAAVATAGLAAVALIVRRVRRKRND